MFWSSLSWHFFHMASTCKSSLENLIYIYITVKRKDFNLYTLHLLTLTTKKTTTTTAILGHAATWVSRDLVWHSLSRLELVSPFLLLLLLLSLFLSFFLSFRVFAVFAFWVFWVWMFVIIIFGLEIETRFPGGRHVEKIPHQTWSTHENRVSKTRFIGPKLSLLNSRC